MEVEALTKQPIALHHFAPPSVTNTYGWMRFIVDNCLPLTAVEDDHIREHVKYRKICYKTLKKYMALTLAALQERIKNELGEDIGILFDGWTHNHIHFVAVFAEYMDKEGRICRPLLAIRELTDPTAQTAQNQQTYLRAVLTQYGAETKVRYLVGDNTATNPATARLMHLPFIGCFSHRLNIIAKKILEPHHTMLKKINTCMVHLSSSTTAAAKWRELCELEPVRRNETRWSSTFKMLERFQKVKEKICSHYIDLGISPTLFLSSVETTSLEAILPDIINLEKCCKHLQQESLTMADAEMYISTLGQLVPATRPLIRELFSKRLCPDFEDGLIAIMKNEALTPAQDEATEIFKLEASDESTASDEETTFERAILKQRKRARTSYTATYMDLSFISPTTNIVERLFSVSKFIYTEDRSSMTGATFEMLQMLKTNTWDMSLLKQVMDQDSAAEVPSDSEDEV